MALKKLMIRKPLETQRAELEALRAKTEEFESREKELEASIEEVTSQEERDAVMEEIVQLTFSGHAETHESDFHLVFFRIKH